MTLRLIGRHTLVCLWWLTLFLFVSCYRHSQEDQLGTELSGAYPCPPLRAKHPQVIWFLTIAMFPHHLYAIRGLAQRAHIMVSKLGSQSSEDLALSPLLYQNAN